MNMTEPLIIRGVQLDLARQMETIEFIKSFIDFISANNFNTLFLYLEARIRTESFPWPSENESYSADEIKEIVTYAANRKIDVVPIVPVLGHAVQFLKHESLHDLAELREGNDGRFWNNGKKTFCPSQKGTCEFLEKYLEDICAIFPSEYFHIGCDESWDIGYCRDCKPKVETFNGEQELFLGHIKRIHQFLSGKLGRQVMMWDDMFDFYPDILSEVPRDVIMVCWQYQSDMQHVQGHFDNCTVHHTVEKYKRLGFKFIYAPADFTTANISTFTSFASQYSPIGGLLTIWEKKTCFLYKSYPAVAYAGQLWSDFRGDQNGAFAEAVKGLFKSDDKKLLQVIRLLCEKGLYGENNISLNTVTCFPFSGLENGELEFLQLMIVELEEIIHEVKAETGKCVIKDFLQALRYNEISLRIRKSGREILVHPEDKILRLNFECLITELEALGRERTADWKQWRKGVASDHFESLYQGSISDLQKFLKLSSTSGLAKIRFCLPDQYSAELIRLKLKYGTKWETFGEGVFKGPNLDQPFFEKYFFIEPDRKPEAFRLEAEGFGGIGLCHVEIRNKSGTYIPDKITAYEGKITDPSFLLDNDCKWSFIGGKNTLASFKDRTLKEKIHYIEADLKPRNR